jgi:hypothetical protein
VSSPLASPPPASTAPPQAQRDEPRLDPTDALLRASHDLTLTEAQRATVDELEQRLDANEKDTRAAFKALQLDLAAQVRSGAVDRARLRADENVAIDALEVHIARETETLTRLHDTLDSSQRTAAVASVRAGAPGRAEAQGTPAQAPPSAEEATRRYLDRMTLDLGLDAAQEQRLSTLLAERAASRQAQEGDREGRMSMVLGAFAGDVFDAKTVVTGRSAAPLAVVRSGIDREVAFVEKLLPILRPDQRDRFASSLERRGDDD